MSDTVTVLIYPDSQFLRLTCGQCGDTVDLVLSTDEEKRIVVEVMYTRDFSSDEEGSDCFCRPVHVIT